MILIHLFSVVSQERKEGGKRGRKPGRKASVEKVDMKAKLGEYFWRFLLNNLGQN